MAGIFRSTSLPIWGFDIETPLLSETAVAPRPICFSLAVNEGAKGYVVQLFAEGDESFWRTIEVLLKKCAEGKLAIVLHHGAYDLTCIAVARPALLSLIFAALAAGNIYDTEIREKLLNLSTHGKLQFARVAQVASDDEDEEDVVKAARVRYRLEDLTKHYLGIDRGVEKSAEDGWRKNFEALAGLPAAQYPAEAAKYVCDDGQQTLQVFEHQDAKVESPDGGPASVKTQEFHVAVAFALRLATVVGIKIDKQRFCEIESEMELLLSEEKMRLLVDAGIMRPSAPSRPKKVSPARQKDIDSGKLPITFTKPVKASIDKKKLAERIELVAAHFGIRIARTAKTGAVSTASGVIESLAPHDEVIAKYQERQEVQKIVTTYLPAMRKKDGTIADRVHPNFNVIVETFRTSSFGDDAYPSTNIQNQDPRTRGCFIPDDGWVFYSVDVSGCELVSIGWKCAQLFGHSALLDHLNTDGDAHAFLGAQIAYTMDAGFRSAVDAAVPGRTPSKQDIYECFKHCKKHADVNVKAFYKKFRTLAKPTGLGYWGGLGPEKFMNYARAQYGVKCSMEEATLFREIWRNTFPEQGAYFDWIKTNCQDPRNPIVGYKDDGRPIQGFAYFSPMGAYRAGCNFTAAANGAGLQTPSAEACKLAYWETVRATYDPSYKSCLHGSRVHAFIHDEVFGAVPRDQWMHERCMEVSRIVAASVGSVFSGAVIRTEPALMERWDKRAEPVYDKSGRLTIWTPPT